MLKLSMAINQNLKKKVRHKLNFSSKKINEIIGDEVKENKQVKIQKLSGFEKENSM